MFPWVRILRRSCFHFNVISLGNRKDNFTSTWYIKYHLYWSPVTRNSYMQHPLCLIPFVYIDLHFNCHSQKYDTEAKWRLNMRQLLKGTDVCSPQSSWMRSASLSQIPPVSTNIWPYQFILLGERKGYEGNENIGLKRKQLHQARSHVLSYPLNCTFLNPVFSRGCIERIH